MCQTLSGSKVFEKKETANILLSFWRGTNVALHIGTCMCSSQFSIVAEKKKIILLSTQLLEKSSVAKIPTNTSFLASGD